MTSTSEYHSLAPLRPGSVILLPEGHDYEAELAVLVESRGDPDAGEAPHWICRVWSLDPDHDGQRVSISHAYAADLAADPLHQITTAAAVMKLGHRWRDEAIRTAGPAYSQHTIAAWAGMSQPGVRKLLGRD